jgi:hypothetical protein
VTWRRVRLLFTRNWKEKLLALVLALLFWFMIRAQVTRPTMPYGMDRQPTRSSRL